jgi:hypothetical protein
MTKQHTRSQSLKSIAGASIPWLGILAVLENLDRALPQFSNLLCCSAREGLGMLLSIVLGTCQATQQNGFDCHQLLECLLRMLLSVLTQLVVTTGAI